MSRKPEIPHQTFYMMRHAQSTTNANGGGYAPADIKLTTFGTAQAFRAQDIIKNLKPAPTCVISSEMDRAVETAIMMTGEEPVIQERKLNELGKEEKYPAHTKRVCRGLSEHLKEGEGVKLFIAHYVTIMRAMEEVGIRTDKKSFCIPNAAVYRFDPPDAEHGRWRVTQISLESGQLQEKILPSKASPQKGGATLTHLARAFAAQPSVNGAHL